LYEKTYPPFPPGIKKTSFSESFKNCTGLIVAGIDKETGESVSFLSHEDPDYFLRYASATEKFADDLRERIQELKDRCEEGTIDAVIVGGNYFSDRPKYRENYLMSIAVVSKEVKSVLGFEPVVITGPKTTSGQDDVFYDNSHRRLYIMRTKVAQEGTKSYLPSDIVDKREGWEKDDQW